jgi:superfamily I DNA/RNA helicase
MHTKLILGGPGAGKTTRLLDTIEEEILAGTMPERIAFCSFTRAAVNEARQRAMKRFNLKARDIPYFRTLHSLCFNKIGMKTNTILSTKDYKAIAARLGIDIGSGSVSPDAGGAMKDGDRMLHMSHMSRATGRTLRDVWLSQGSPFSFELLEQFVATVKAYKLRYKKCDFTDMLEIFVDRSNPLPLDVAIIDEAQDLTPLEWAVAKRAFERVDRRYIAGDDDQAIYTWSGADVQQFMMVSHNEVEVLPKSNRLPEEVFKFADRFINAYVSSRFVKDWSSTGKEGAVNFISELSEIDVSNGNWYLLARNTCFLERYREHLRDQGLVYWTKGSLSLVQQHVDAIRTYEAWRTRGSVDRSQAQMCLAYMHGQRSILPERCHIDNFGKRDDPWFVALDKIDVGLRLYYRKVLRRHGCFPDSSDIYVDTIHSVKGGEADNVVIQTDITNRTFDTLVTHEEDECRVFYVGATRARENLYIMYPKARNSFDLFFHL